MRRAFLLATLLLAAVIHAETPVAPPSLDARKMAAAAVLRIEKPDGALVATGVIVSPDGYFLMKASEVQKPGELTLRLPDGKVVKTREVRRDARLDLALGRCLDVSGLVPVKWNESKSIAQGQWLISSTQGGRETRIGVMSARRRAINVAFGGSASVDFPS